MIDRLVDFLLNFIDQLLPIQIIKQYQKGVLLRFGKYKKILNPGLHFKIPFFDSIDDYVIVTTTLTLPVQSIVTKDGKSVVIKGQVKYKVQDLVIFAIEVYDAVDALSDMTCGIIFDKIKNRTYKETQEQDLNKLITTDVKKEAKKWGIFVEKVTITDYSEMTSLRLFNEQLPSTKDISVN